ncbi:AraC family transcriptional regulator [Neorhizobium sp. P12A]|uniref:helix-turn-helix domain-containing protein n=1 Tax=Neorhizobium sp. P12A TaxID=2268027 RepID=UPI0011EC4B43|nr:AraC family transcriptional regulator [Neorhizobium sp. P12A]KAA0692007.1 AraC family transcriptional regulator [Neorhizobium sp. P12A]
MPSIPLPFVTALLLVVLLARMVGRDGLSCRPLSLFVALCAVQAIVLGLRWNFDWSLAHFFQPIVAATLPPLAWLGFEDLRQPDARIQHSSSPHAIPAIVIAVMVFVWSNPIDIALIVLFFGYGSALLWVARQGPDTLSAARFGDAVAASRSLATVGLLFILAGVVEIAIALDIGGDSGAGMIVGSANIVALIIIGYAAAVAGRSRVFEEPGGPVVAVQAQGPRPLDGGTGDDPQILATVDRLMRERKLYRDPNLTLDRLARRAGIPARHISTAVNRVHGRNVSQIVNEYRVEEAQRLLADTAAPVTEIMFEAGFLTKSNFNREFLRVTGLNPSGYRRSVRPAKGDT